MKTLTEALNEGIKMGFEQARENPETTLEEFLESINSVYDQLNDMPSWKLRLLCGEDNAYDRFRMKLWKRCSLKEHTR